MTHNFFRPVSWFVMGAVLGLVLYLLGASALGWIPAVWWGGSALLIPASFGLAVVIVGAIPFYVIAKKWIDRLGGAFSLSTTFVVGVLVGASFLPISDVLGMLLRPIPLWQSLNPWVRVVFTLVVAGVLSSLLGATLVGVFLRSRLR